MKNNRDSVIKIQFAVVVIGGYLALMGIFKVVIPAYSAQSWPTTEGLILISEIHKHEEKSRGEDRLGSIDRTEYKLELKFKYKVNGKTFYSEKLRIAAPLVINYDKSKVEKIHEKYPKDSQVTVYYNPEDPADAVLDNTISLTTWTTPLLGFGILFGGLILTETVFRIHRAVTATQ